MSGVSEEQMKTSQTILFIAYLCLAMIVLGGTIFSVLVEYPNWFANIPASLEATRNFYKVFHPGYFFQTVVPFTFLAGIASAIIGWRIRTARNLVLLSLAALFSAEMLTFIYIYPRLGIMFGPDAGSQTIDALKLAAQQFTDADRIRTGLSVLTNLLAVCAVFSFFRRQTAEA
jgi:hypothetical protein